MVKPVRRRELVRHLKTAYAVSERRACTASGFGRASHRYQLRRDPCVNPIGLAIVLRSPPQLWLLK